MKKYIHLSSIARLLKITAGPEVRKLIDWLIENRKTDREQIEVQEWTAGMWYVVVTDEQLEAAGVKHPGDCLIGFTIHVQDDKLVWTNDNSYNFSGANCFVRSHRWHRLLKQKFPEATVGKDNVRTGKLPPFHLYDYRVKAKRTKQTA